jgi:hypothetical protein
VSARRAVQVERLPPESGEACYRASCPACGTAGEARSSPPQAKAALAEVHRGCRAVALPLRDPTR